MLSLSLDTGLESFSSLLNGAVNDGLFKVSCQWLLQFSDVTYWLLIYTLLYGAVVAMETAQFALKLYRTF